LISNKGVLWEKMRERSKVKKRRKVKKTQKKNKQRQTTSGIVTYAEKQLELVGIDKIEEGKCGKWDPSSKEFRRKDKSSLQDIPFIIGENKIKAKKKPESYKKIY